MASNTIKALAEEAGTIIAALTPDVEPLITFRQPHYNLPLAEQPPTGSPNETTRQFHVLPGTTATLSKWRRGQTALYFAQDLIVQIRYQIPRADGGVKRLADLVGTDIPAIHQALTLQPSGSTWSASAVIRSVDLPSIISPPTLVNPGAWIWLLEINYQIQYVLA